MAQTKIEILAEDYITFVNTKRRVLPLEHFDKVAIRMFAKWASAQQSLHLTALRRGLTLSILFNVVLLAVALIVIGGR